MEIIMPIAITIVIVGFILALVFINKNKTINNSTPTFDFRINRRNSIEQKGEEGEKMVSSLLMSLKETTLFINNLVLKDGEMTHQIDHVAIRENGIFCIETKNWDGAIYGNEKSSNWYKYLGKQKYEIENPVKQNLTHVYEISKVLDKKYKIIPIVVMVQNNTDKISADEVIKFRDLKTYLENYIGDNKLTHEEMQNIFDILTKANATEVTNEEHIENIHKQEEKINEGICPRCGGKLVERNGKYGKFLSCENYPKCKFRKKIDEEKTA